MISAISKACWRIPWGTGPIWPVRALPSCLQRSRLSGRASSPVTIRAGSIESLSCEQHGGRTRWQGCGSSESCGSWKASEAWARDWKFAVGLLPCAVRVQLDLSSCHHGSGWITGVRIKVRAGLRLWVSVSRDNWFIGKPKENEIKSNSSFCSSFITIQRTSWVELPMIVIREFLSAMPACLV